MINKTFDYISKEDRQIAIDSLIAFFESERGEKIGVIAAEEILDSVLDNVGKKIYNKAITDVVKQMQLKFDSSLLETETDLRKD